MRRRWSLADARSASEHGDGKGVTCAHQRMGTRELPTPPCGPRRLPPVWPGSEPRSPGTARPEGSRTRGARPDRPAGHPQATMRPRTVRGRPPGRNSCPVPRNGSSRRPGRLCGAAVDVEQMCRCTVHPLANAVGPSCGGPVYAAARYAPVLDTSAQRRPRASSDSGCIRNAGPETDRAATGVPAGSSTGDATATSSSSSSATAVA
jgi:hypothetical protein